MWTRDRVRHRCLGRVISDGLGFDRWFAPSNLDKNCVATSPPHWWWLLPDAMAGLTCVEARFEIMDMPCRRSGEPALSAISDLRIMLIVNNSCGNTAWRPNTLDLCSTKNPSERSTRVQRSSEITLSLLYQYNHFTWPIYCEGTIKLILEKVVDKGQCKIILRK